METICSTGTRLIRPNFIEQEVYSKSPNAPDCHPLSNKTLDGIQLVREFWGAPTSVTSTYRTASHNTAIGGSATSQHITGAAIDIQPVDASIRFEKIKAFYEDMVCKGPLYQSLKNAGVKGVGIYNSFVHLDDGSNPANIRPSMQFWDQSSGNYGPVQLTTAFMNTVPESGAPDCGTVAPEVVQQFASKKKA